MSERRCPTCGAAMTLRSRNRSASTYRCDRCGARELVITAPGATADPRVAHDRDNRQGRPV